MNDLFNDDVHTTVCLPCANCGVAVELARSALSLFESEDTVLCMECLVRVGDTPRPTIMTLEERVALIDEVVEDFSGRLRDVLLRSVRPDLSWNGEYGSDDWTNPADSVVAGHAPGVWYAGKKIVLARRRAGA